MASDTETLSRETHSESGRAQESSSVSDRLLRNRDVYLFLPFVLGFSNRETQQNPNQQPTVDNNSSRERVVLVNPFTQGMVVIDGASSLDPLLRAAASDPTAHPPASKASIDSMPRQQIGENDCTDGECMICLDEWVVGDVVQEMPCKHRFHSKCIHNWLEIHGTCPVCRFKMPVEEEEAPKTRTTGEREIWVSFRFNGDANNGIQRNRESDQIQNSVSPDDEGDSNPLDQPEG